MAPSLVFDLSALPYLLRLFPGPYRMGVPGWLVLVGSDCASQRGVASRGSAHPLSEKRVRVGSGVCPGFPVREAIWRWARVRKERCSSLARPSHRRGRPESEAGTIPPRLGLPVGDWITILACRLGIWAGPGVARHS